MNKGRHIMASYRIVCDCEKASGSGKLSVCYNLKGDSYPEEFSTKGKPLFFLAVFERVE